MIGFHFGLECGTPTADEIACATAAAEMVFEALSLNPAVCYEHHLRGPEDVRFKAEYARAWLLATGAAMQAIHTYHFCMSWADSVGKLRSGQSVAIRFKSE